MKDTRGTDVVIIGLLVYLAWKEYNNPFSPIQGGGGLCNVSNIPSVQEPLSTIYGPAWTRTPEPIYE